MEMSKELRKLMDVDPKLTEVPFVEQRLSYCRAGDDQACNGDVESHGKRRAEAGAGGKNYSRIFWRRQVDCTSICSYEQLPGRPRQSRLLHYQAAKGQTGKMMPNGSLSKTACRAAACLWFLPRNTYEEDHFRPEILSVGHSTFQGLASALPAKRDN